MIYGHDKTSKIISIGPNFRAFRAQRGIVHDDDPFLSLKSPESLTFADKIYVSARMGHSYANWKWLLLSDEDAKNIEEHEAASVVAGYAIANDMTAADHFDDGWFKMYDQMTPIGPMVQLDNPSDVNLEMRVNGECIQQDHTSQMLFSPAWQVSHLSRIMTLRKGDVILSGTPANPKICQVGDVIELLSPQLGNVLHTIHWEP
jgi:hypothetical protein